MSHRPKLWRILLGIFAASFGAIVIGFYPFRFLFSGLSWMGVEWLFEGVPVFLGAVVSTALVPFTGLFAFYFGGPHYDGFRGIWLTFSFGSPLGVVLVVPPSTPDVLSMSGVLYPLLIVIHMVGARWVAPSVWEAGGREMPDNPTPFWGEWRFPD